MKKICFLVSGGGGTMKFIDKAIQHLSLSYNISNAIADRECGAIDYCNSNSIPNIVLSNWKEDEKKIGCILQKYSPDIVITTIHKKILQVTIQSSQAIFINLHYSLLPAYGGVIGFKTLELAKEKQAKIIGVTTHYVTDELDGGEIIAQAAMPVDWSETMESIGDKIFRMACLTMLNSIIRIFNPTETNIENPKDTIYSPKLCFPRDGFSEGFWNSLR